MPREAALTGHCLVISSQKTRPWQVEEITSRSEMDLGLPGKMPDTTFPPLPGLITGLPPGAQWADRLPSAQSQQVGLGRDGRWVT